MIRLFVLLVVVAVPINCLGAVKLYYYSGPNVDSVDLQNVNLNDVLLDPSKQFKILCHGWKASSLVPWYLELTEAYLAKGHQVLAVDWAEDAAGDYDHVFLVANEVGQIIAHKIIQLATNSGLKYDKVHIIGHSLGAHIAGLTGKHVISEVPGLKLGRITGLDPAAPQYHTVPPTKRLDADDAKFVDVIHTSVVLGLQIPIGDADFYPDGGSSQLACLLDINPLCSHFIAPDYMIESVTSNKFVAKPLCSIIDIKCLLKPNAIMGEGCDPSARGKYILFINKH